MKKGKMFKKSISCLLAALMIIASMPFSAISASAATGTLSAKSYEIVRGGGNTRWENNQFNIVNDQEADNTSIGIIEYDISSLKGMVINSASLNFTIDSYIGDSQGLVFYYSNRLTNVTLNKNSTKDTLTNTSYGAGTVANESAASRYGFSTGNVLAYGNVNTSAQTSDIKTQLQTIVDSGATSLYVFVMQKNAGGSNNARLSDGVHDDKTGWTDTKIKPTNVTINVNYDVDNRPVTLDQAKAKLNSFNYTSIKTQTGKWYDSSKKELSMPSGTYSNLLYAGDSNADNGSFTGNGTGTVGYLRYQQSVFLYDDQNTPTAPIMVVYGYTGTGNRYVGAITLSDNRNNSLKLVDYWKCSRARSYGNNWDYPNVWAQNGNDDINPSYDYSKPSTTGAQIASNSSIFNRWSVAPGMANKMQYDGKMSNTTYSQDIQMTVDFYQGGNSNDTLSIHDTINGNKKCYVVNYKVVLDKIKQAKTDINTVKDEYSERTKTAYAKALYDLVTFNPASLSFSDSTLDSDVNTAGDKIKTLIKNYDQAYSNLSIDYTFIDINNNSTVVAAKNANEAYKHKPANTVSNSKPLNEKQHTKYTYTWPTSPSDYVFTEQKEEVTENHDFRTLDTCTCGAKVDVESFEAAHQEALNILGQEASLYDTPSLTNFMNTASPAFSKRSNGELLCQDDFDRATCEILYAKTLLKKNQGTVTLTVYDVNGNEVSDAGDTFTGNYGDTVTVKPKNKCNIVKWVIETNTAKKELVGELPNIDLVVTGDTTVKAYCDNTATDTEHSYTKVIFKGSNGKVSAIKYVKVGEKLKTDTVEKPSLALYTIGDWNVSEVVGSADKAEVTVIAPCEPNTSYQCGIHFAGKGEEVIYKPYDTRIDINDYIQNNNVTYALATDDKGQNIIAYIDGTVFYVPARADVYVVENSGGTKETMINTVGVYTTTRGTGENAKKTIGFNCKFSLAEGCKALEWGVVFIPIYNKAGGGTKIGTSTVAPIRSLSAQNEYTARINIPASSTSYNSIKAKAYLKYRDEAGEHIKYGNENTQAFDPSTRFWEVK